MLLPRYPHCQSGAWMHSASPNSPAAALNIGKTPVTGDDLIYVLAHQPYYEHEAMSAINKVGIANPASTAPQSIGLLDVIPVEVMHCVLDELDFQSLFRFSQASLRANSIVRSLHSYREVMTYAPAALKALARTGLIVYHSAATLRATLRSHKCVSCRWYGTFLFLPTCERCCSTCLQHNQSLWVIPRETAAQCFTLYLGQIYQLPVMNVPSYGYFGKNSKGRKLVSLKAAKELALSIHGSEEEIAARLVSPRRRLPQSQRHAFGHFQAAPMGPLSDDQVAKLNQGSSIIDPFRDKASVRISHLTSRNRVENGLWCLSCGWQDKNYYRAAPLASTMLVPDEITRRGRSQAEFLEHIKTCHGVPNLLKQAGLEHWLGAKALTG